MTVAAASAHDPRPGAGTLRDSRGRPSLVTDIGRARLAVSHGAGRRRPPLAPAGLPAALKTALRAVARADLNADQLVALRGLSRELRIPIAWLRAEAGRVPCPRAGRKRLFNVEAVRLALLRRAAREAAQPSRHGVRGEEERS